MPSVEARRLAPMVYYQPSNAVSDAVDGSHPTALQWLDPYVIAFSACRLGQLEMDLHSSIPQLPYAVEAVFPVGAIEQVIDPKSMETVKTRHGHQWSIRKPSGAEVATDRFLNSDYAGVSAVLGSPAG